VDAFNSVFENDMKVALTVQTLDSRKQVVRETYFDAAENYAKTDDGIVTYRYEYDTSGNQIETTAYDSIDKPREFKADVATIRWKYDAQGNKLQTTYFNRNNELAITADSVTYNVYAYNERNDLVRRTNFDSRMQPAEIDGTFRFVVHTNTSGLDSLTLEYDSKNHLRKGVAITKYHYTPYGSVSRIEYIDRNNKRTKNENGVSAINYLYNNRHLLTGYEYLDEKNRLTNNTDGVALEKWTLDGLGHTLTYAYFDQYKNPVIGEYGYHRIDYEWSPVGQWTRTTIYGKGLELIPDEFGTAVYQYTLNKSGMIQTIERFNPEGIIANNTDSIAITHYEHNLNGLYFLEKELNAAGEIVNDSIIDQ
jgi:YD repeat-containing protein